MVSRTQGETPALRTHQGVRPAPDRRRRPRAAQSVDVPSDDLPNALLNLGGQTRGRSAVVRPGAVIRGGELRKERMVPGVYRVACAYVERQRRIAAVYPIFLSSRE